MEPRGNLGKNKIFRHILWGGGGILEFLLMDGV